MKKAGVSFKDIKADLMMNDDVRFEYERLQPRYEIISQIIAARKEQGMTQAELASRIDKKRTFISKVENDGENITLKTLFDIVERGLGGKLNIEVQL